MPSHATAAQPVGKECVVVGLRDGDTLEGQLQSFVPFLPFLKLLPLAEGEPANRIPRGTMAWVGFHHDAGTEPEVPPWNSNGLEVEVNSGRKFLVAVKPGAQDNALGFTALPISPDDPYRAIFFYREQVAAIREVDLPAELLAPRSDDPLEEVEPEHDDLAELPETALEPIPSDRLHLSDLLVERKLVTPMKLAQARELQAATPGRPLGRVLLELGAVGEADLYRAIARRFGLAYVDLNEIPINSESVRAVPKKLLWQCRCIPLDLNETSCLLAVSEPQEGAAATLAFALNREVREVIASPSQIEAQLRARLMGTAQGIKEGQKQRSSLVVEHDQSVIQLVDQILRDANVAEASDIHIEPYGERQDTIVRFRADGECYVYQKLPPQFWKAIVNRVKIMARLDIAERRLPQDGKILFELDENTKLEFRVATLPTTAGNEDVVLRLLAQSKPHPLDAMGFSARNLLCLQRAIARPHGLVLCVGPTGSGKTTTLHSALGAINIPSRKIWTAEDPVEITQQGIRQVQVDPKIGLTFARAMRSFLRADPDVVMIGEMRDPETAQIAIEASLTGHLVMSTLHTNSAPETLTRLLDMGLDPFTFADSLVAVLAQRLMRRLCPSCRAMLPASSSDYQQLADLYGPDFEKDLGFEGPDGLLLPAPRGCRECGDNGFRGRLAIHELLVADDGIARAIHARATASEIRDRACAGGMKTLLQDGITKVIAGQTSLKQLLTQCSR